MRRTEQEFKAEVLRRSEQYRSNRKKRRQKLLNTTLCCLLIFCGIFLMRPLFMASGGSTGAPAMDMAAEEIEMNAMVYSVEEDMAEQAEPEAAEQESPMKMESGMTTSKENGAGDGAWDLIPMVMIDGVLYLDTGYDSDAEGRCGVMDGEITSAVSGSEQPTEDDQSNFGTGYGYQFGATEGTVEIYMNGNWRIFATEEVRREMQFP